MPIEGVAEIDYFQIKTAQRVSRMLGLGIRNPKLLDYTRHDIVELKFECGHCSSNGFVTLEGYDKPPEGSSSRPGA